MNHVYLMTKNKGKIAAAQSVFDRFGIEVKSLDFDVPEIQADSQVARILEKRKKDLEKTYPLNHFHLS